MSKKKATVRRTPLLVLLVLVYAGLIALFIWLIRNGQLQLLEPAGYIAQVQSWILWGTIIFAIIVGGFILGAFYFVAFRYREGARARYEPNWSGGKLLHLAGWAIPFVAISILSPMVWQTTYQVDPYRPISSVKEPVTVQVVALRWKWLFIYPKEHIATVNYLEIPTGTPIAFELTADAPMNSFWIPRLGGQIYAMPGMVTKLHLQADKTGTYAGNSAEISGDGFAGMNFTVNAVLAQDYAAWATAARQTAAPLDYAAYTQLAKPSSYNPPAFYAVSDQQLFHKIVMQFMTATDTHGLAGHHHRNRSKE
jgi:cytochrome o ubiquinol oxidase subunit 2